VFDEPRDAIAAVPGTSMIEMERRREGSFCCGAGGGRAFAEEPVENRVSNLRAREALATGADVVGVGCPFCMNMMEEAVNTEKGDRDVKVRDIAELLHSGRA
jgi:Fe-S oxidoreductase